MNAEVAAELSIDCARMARIVSEWYARNPDISRLWLYETGEPDPDDARAIRVVVALTPVCDSDETGPIWLARCAGWERQLHELIGHPVALASLDGPAEVVTLPDSPDHALVCLARMSWRDAA